MELTCTFREVTAIRFTEGLMSSETPPIQVGLTIRGDHLIVAYHGKRYAVAVADIATALVESVAGGIPEAE